MKTPSFTVKLITVSFFITFIICFIWYRVDAVGESTYQEYSELNKDHFNSNPLTVADTPIVKKDSLRKEMMMSSSKSTTIMSSSKSIIMPSSKSIALPHPNFGFDTLKEQKNTDNPSDTTKKKPLKKTTMMSSSKSAHIYEPEPTPDTAKKPKK